MNNKFIGAGARWVLNALTGILSLFGVWGWLSDIESWPPTLVDAGSLALAAVTATTQHLANAAAAHAFYALQAGRGFTCLVGLMLAVAFAAVTSQGIEHALANHDAFKREEVAAPIRDDISNLEASIQSDRGALRRLPADVPGSRLLILQAPLRAAIDDGEARLLVLRAQLAETLAQGDDDDGRRRLFALLGFCEPAAYWLLASSASRPMRPVPTSPRAASHVAPEASRRRRRVPEWAAAAMATLASIAPGAAAPPRDLGVVPAAQTAPPPHQPSSLRETVVSPRGTDRAGQAPNDGPRHASVVRRDLGHVTPAPVWLEEAKALRIKGLSYRGIERALKVPRSTLWRWLNESQAT
jgi:hypothetical protein